MSSRRQERRLAIEILFQADVTATDGRSALSGWLESELRFFPNEGLYAGQRRAYPALGSELRADGALARGVFRSVESARSR